MRALMLTAYGTPPDLRVDTVEDPPPPSSNEIVIRLEAAGLNPLDLKVASGAMAAAMPRDLPALLGWDGAGRVVEIGADVTRFAVGDKVLLMVAPPTGTVAELVVIGADSDAVEHRPAGLGATSAAALPMVALTAATVVREMRPATTALVLGASGGIGAFLLPLLRDAGVEVFATGGPDDLGRLRRAGASEVIDYRAEEPMAAVRRLRSDGVDVVIDLVNQLEALVPSAELVRNGGQLISTLFGPPVEGFGRPDLVLTYIRNEARPGVLADAAARVVSGEVELPIVSVRPLADAASAVAALQAQGGKHVVTMMTP